LVERLLNVGDDNLLHVEHRVERRPRFLLESPRLCGAPLKMDT
jgi:hypothetical protein